MEKFLAQLKEEKTEAKNSISKVLVYTQNITDRVDQNISFFSKYISNINEIIRIRKTDVAPLKLREFKDDAPGFPGTDLNLFNEYFKLLNALSEIQEISAYKIKKDIVHRMTELEEDFKATFERLKQKVENQRVERSKALDAFVAREQTLQKAKSKAEALHSSHQQDPNPKLQKSLEDACEEFRSAKVAYRQAYKELCSKHKNYITTVNQTILRIKAAEISRCSELKCITCLHAQNFDSAAEIMGDICSDINAPSNNWKAEFVSFAEKSGIVRTSFSPREYSPLQFSFENSKLDFKHAPQTATMKSCPLAFAVLKQDFNEEGVSLKEGERVYIYDNLKASKSYIQTKERESLFIPSDVLEEINGEYNIATVPYIAVNDSEISISSGDLIMEIPSEDGKMYEKIDGSKGFIPSFVLLEEI
jgi:hypothetical protein